jgi:hypothetical protein
LATTSPLGRVCASLAILASLSWVAAHAPALHNHSDSDSAGNGCAVCQMLASVTPDLPACPPEPARVVRADATRTREASDVYEAPLRNDSTSPRGPPSPLARSVIS